MELEIRSGEDYLKLNEVDLMPQTIGLIIAVFLEKNGFKPDEMERNFREKEESSRQS